MNLLYILFIAFANNIDNISVRIAYSIKGIKISAAKNLWISFITFAIASTAAFLGQFVSVVVSPRISSYISMIFLTAIGVWILIEPYISKRAHMESENDDQEISLQGILKNPEKADINNSKDIDYKEATFLGIALSMDNIGGGFSAGIIGLNVVFIGAVSAVISFAALWIGHYIAGFLSRWNIGKKASVISGILLILIGLNRII
ncbi:MAG: sporulation membrane protein YtaF [Clostridiaceae bacterium]